MKDNQICYMSKSLKPKNINNYDNLIEKISSLNRKKSIIIKNR
jgi:hypothetical protein